METGESFCAHRAKSSDASNVHGHKLLTKWVPYLCIEGFFCLFIGTFQSAIDQREQTLHLDFSEKALTEDRPVHLGY